MFSDKLYRYSKQFKKDSTNANHPSHENCMQVQLITDAAD